MPRPRLRCGRSTERFWKMTDELSPGRMTTAAVTTLIVAAGLCWLSGCELPPEGLPDADVGPDADADVGPDVGPDADADADEERALIEHVDPMIGTGGLGFGVGSAFPGPQVPFGMARPGPDTTGPDNAPGANHCAGYWYDDALIRGFGQTRPHGMGVPDYGAVGVMATVGMDASETSWWGHRSSFRHDTEEASPGYYAVTLARDGVRAELTAGDRVGLHRFTFPEVDDAVVLIDAGHFLADVEIIDGRVEHDPEAGEVWGFATFSGSYSGRFGGMPVYFHARASRPPVEGGLWSEGELLGAEVRSADGPSTGAWLRYDATAEPTVEVAVGLSFVSEEGALANLDAEVSEVDFDGARALAEGRWEEILGRIEVEGGSDRDLELFYTALYHSLLMPTLAMDVDGRYRGLDGEVHRAEGYVYFTDFSLWDTFRTLHPLLTLVYPELQLEMVRSLAAMGRDGGVTPRWPLGIGYTGGMVGDPADLVFADSWVKGVRDFDLAAAYEVLRRTATGPMPPGSLFGGRSGIAEYQELGYVPIEATGSSGSVTLEYAYADYGLGQLAEALGEEVDAAMFGERAGSWRNLWDAESRFLAGRHADGSFSEVDDPGRWQDFWAEGNSWHYLWYAPHDLEGLAEVMGGREVLLERLDHFFESSADRESFPLLPSPWYWHGNEPDLHAPWIYAALDRPADSARWVRWAMERHYGDGPDGLPGNDDSGTLSAWFVFSAIGLYPIAGLDHYLIGSPIFDRVVVHLAGGDLVIEATGAAEGALYVQRATLDGEPLERARVAHDDLAGATLRLEMGHEPSGWARSTP